MMISKYYGTIKSLAKIRDPTRPIKAVSSGASILSRRKYMSKIFLTVYLNVY